MADIQVLATSDASDDLLRRVRTLLDDAFVGDFSDDDWEHALGGWHVLVCVDGQLVSHAAVVPRVLDIGGHRFHGGYVEAVGTQPGSQRGGHGARAMEQAGEVIRRHHEVGVLSTGRHRFYERLGWERWQGPSFVLDDEGPVRTADEDDGIMVLRFGPSAEVALTDAIACRSRRGDDW